MHSINTFSGINATKTKSGDRQLVRNVGKCRENRGDAIESTEDFTNLDLCYLSHQGEKDTFDSEHFLGRFEDPNQWNEDDKSNFIIEPLISNDNDSNDDDVNSDDDDPPAQAIDGPIDLNMGTTKLDGLRNSIWDYYSGVWEMFESLCATGGVDDIEIAPYLPDP